MKFSRLYRRTILALSAVAVLSLPSSVLFYYRLNQEKQATEVLSEVREKIGVIDELLTQLLNLETGVRGYVSTGDTRFLDPYWEGRRQAPIVLKELGREQTELADKVNRVIVLSDQLIQNPTVAKLEEGKATMDEIRKILKELKTEDEQIRDRLLLKRDKRGRRDLILSIGAVLVITLLLWLIYQSASNMKAVFDKAEQALGLEEKLRLATEAARQETEKVLEQERQLSQAKSAIIQTISHEYRTPLTAILTAVELIEVRPEKTADYAEQIKKGVKRLTGLVDDVLEVFRLQSEFVELNPVVINLRRWFTELAQETGQRDRVGLDIESITLHCDESLLHKIFSNLVSNALKYSNEVVFVRARQLQSGDVEISVKDTGIGIPLSTRLFQAFERGDNVGVIQGTGLGLSIVKKAVDLLGGSITVESEEGVGTTVTVMLPSSC